MIKLKRKREKMSKLLSRIENNKYFVYISMVLCTLLLSFTCDNNPFSIGNMNIDSSVFNYVARVIRNGGMPYRDTFDHKGPLLYLINVLGQVIHSYLGLWLIECVFIFFTFFYAYKIARYFNCGNVKCIMVIIINTLAFSYYFDGGNMSEEYACLFITISLYIFIKFFSEGKVKKTELLIAGISFGAVCLLRINMIPLWIVMCLGVLIICIKKKEIGKLFVCVGFFILGIAVVTAPIMLWLAVNDAVVPFIEDYFSFNFLYSSDPSRASLGNIAKALSTLSTGAVTVISCPVLIYLGIKKKELIDWLCLSTLLLSVIVICISGQLYNHYGMILIPIITYAFARLFADAKEFRNGIPLLAAGGVMMLILFSSSFLNIGLGLIKPILKIESGSFSELNKIAEIIKANSDEDDKISVCGNKNILYLKSDRFSSSIYSYQYPIAEISGEIKKNYIEDLKKLDARIFVIDENNEIYGDVEDIIKQHYELVDKVNTTEIYKLVN